MKAVVGKLGKALTVKELCEKLASVDPTLPVILCIEDTDGPHRMWQGPLCEAVIDLKWCVMFSGRRRAGESAGESRSET